ncbi:nitroreductase family protein [Pseudochryseolinea flava]|nr:nitroreductase family protein [Pseudochryseolinea flava]
MKSDNVDFPISELIRRRKSVRAFTDQLVEQDKLNSLFEATRWAPSSTNEQPWLYIYASKDQTALWNKLFEALNDGNKIWVKDAPLLIVSFARKNFTRFPGPNAHAMYDLGGANAFLALQAVELGLQVRQIAGFNAAKVMENLNVPDLYEPGVFLAVGYPGSPESLPENLKLREAAPRERNSQQVFVMNQVFDNEK